MITKSVRLVRLTSNIRSTYNCLMKHAGVIEGWISACTRQSCVPLLITDDLTLQMLSTHGLRLW